MIANSVVLPAPFGPISAVMRPSSAANEARSTASSPPKRLAMTFSHRSSGLSHGALRCFVARSAAAHAAREDTRDAARRERHDQHQHAAVDHEVEPGRVRRSSSLVTSPSVRTTSAPSSGPYTVPMPPMIGASSASTEIQGP